jgi:hypothetical protein
LVQEKSLGESRWERDFQELSEDRAGESRQRALSVNLAEGNARGEPGSAAPGSGSLSPGSQAAESAANSLEALPGGSLKTEKLTTL